MKNLIVAFAAAMLLTGCSTSEGAPLFFGQTQTAGIAIGVNPATSVPEITVGYEDANVANVPTAIAASGEEGRVIRLTGGGFDRGKEFTDAYSTFGQFDIDVGTGQDSAEDDQNSEDGEVPTARIALGKFFATGLAARFLAEGFACEISGGTHSACEHEAKDDNSP